jgi:two-component system, response regulator PdtaR
MIAHPGYDVVLAEGGGEGLELFCQERPDLVVTDVYMPEKNGIEVILELKKRESKTKIIAMSGEDGADSTGERSRSRWVLTVCS